MTDFVCIGDVTQDNFFFINDAEVHCDLRTDECELALKYGEKIPAEDIGVSVGGNGGNVAAGLAKLGLRTKLLTVFGGDERGVWIKRQLLAANVDLEDSVTEEKRMSNMAGIILFRRERTILTYHAQGEAKLGEIPETKWIYVSSPAGKDQGETYNAILKYKEQHKEVKIAANPPLWDLKRGKETIQPVLGVLDVLILNWEEAETLLGSKKSKIKGQKSLSAKETLTQLATMGPKVVVVTDGTNGAYAGDGKGFWFCKPYGMGAVEPTGAGDAFSSGFLANYSQTGVAGMAMVWGAVNAFSVIQKIGGQAGLLSREEITVKPGQNPDWGPEEI
ncbi:carbohydrate kinase family protein [Candidatus Microgenomates bacterium]|nr:carbohydrate kinase family protein [Candidatus Microgenomates bacterium]